MAVREVTPADDTVERTSLKASHKAHKAAHKAHKAGLKASIHAKIAAHKAHHAQKKGNLNFKIFSNFDIAEGLLKLRPRRIRLIRLA